MTGGMPKDYVECMWLILQNKQPEDFVIATGEQHSRFVRFVANVTSSTQVLNWSSKVRE